MIYEGGSNDESPVEYKGGLKRRFSLLGTVITVVVGVIGFQVNPATGAALVLVGGATTAAIRSYLSAGPANDN